MIQEEEKFYNEVKLCDEEIDKHLEIISQGLNDLNQVAINIGSTLDEQSIYSY